MIDLSEEYRTAAAGAGWHLNEDRGRLRVRGRDATALLHALMTADFASVGPGGGTYAAYLTPQGRMITDFAAYRTTDGWLLDVPPGVAASLLAKLDSVIFAEEVQLADATTDTALITVIGIRAAEIAGVVLDIDAARLGQLTTRATVEAGDILVARTDAATIDTFDLFVPAARVEDVTRRLSSAGGRSLSRETMDLFRIEAGRPAFGVDMQSDTIPLEAGLLERAISQSKGCYVGQEVIVRVLHRGGGRVAKRLMQIEANGDGAIAIGGTIAVDGKDVGVITSAAFSPERGRWIALGYVHRDFAAVGQPVAIANVPAAITAAAG
jgi:folate-binding protein YgfZ